MIATELAQRYAGGESLNTLACEYHLSKRAIAKTVRAMGGEIRPPGFDFSRAEAGRLASARKAHEKRMAPGEHCQRCEILLRFDPGKDGLCGECFEEVSHVVVFADTLHRGDPGMSGEAADGTRF